MGDQPQKTGFRATVKIGSVDIPFNEIMDLTVKSELDLPDSFSITLGDTDTVRKNILPKIKLHDKIDAKIHFVGDEPDFAFVGELVRKAPISSERGSRGGQYVLMGYNAMHALTRGHGSTTFKNQTDKDIVDKVLQDNSSLKLTADYGKEPPTIKYEHVYQYNKNDLQFILDRAKRSGYYVLVRDDKLLYQKRDPTPSPYKLKSAAARQQGDDKNIISLEHFTPTLSTSSQVTEVHVRTFNPKTRKELIGKAPKAAAGKGAAQLGGDTGKDAIAEKYPESIAVVWRKPFSSQEEGDMLAAAVLEERLLSYVTAEGSTPGDPRIKPAIVVEITTGDATFDGKYFICGVKHRYHMGDGDTFKTDFFAKRDATEKPKQQ